MNTLDIKSLMRIGKGLPALLWVLALMFATPALAQKKAADKLALDELMVQLRDAARSFDSDKVQALAAKVPRDYVLAPYADFWAFRARFITKGMELTGKVSEADLRDYLTRNDGTFMADRIRNDWLLVLGRQRDWARFDQEYPRFVLQDDPQLVCYALLSRLAKGEVVGREANALLDKSAANAAGEGCISLTQSLVESGAWGPSDLWKRIRVLHEGNQVSAAKKLASLLPNDQRPDADGLDQAWDTPSRLLVYSGGVEPRARRELTVLALARLARQDTTGAGAGIINGWLKKLPAPDARFVRLTYAAYCGKRLGSDCNDWLKDVEGASASEETLGWAARAALRALDWKALARVLALMNESQFSEPTWTYWNARTLQALGAPREDWVTALERIRTGFDFYNLLAREELGERFVPPARLGTFTDAELAEASASPHAPRAFEFYRLNMRFEGNREWNWQLRGPNGPISDSKLAAFAEFGRRSGYLDRMVNSAERSREKHDFTQRYPTPFVDKLAPIAQGLGLDLAWVYGLIRQESRFVMNARSSVGASGLMQLMPATARHVAKKIGMEFEPGRIDDLERNLTLGSNYLAMVYADLDSSPMLASAAYNAGPGRPRSWRASLTKPVEGAIFAETIPFTETRGYVKNVLANAVIYAAMMGQTKAPTLKERLGKVAPKAAGTTDLP
jgi:soluble lytic murein transglycosylase